MGTARREVLDHLLIFGERHLEHVLKEFIQHYRQERPHRSLGLRPPCPPPLPASSTGSIVRRDRLGGSTPRCAGINRHEGGNERALHRRPSEPSIWRLLRPNLGQPDRVHASRQLGRSRPRTNRSLVTSPAGACDQRDDQRKARAQVDAWSPHQATAFSFQTVAVRMCLRTVRSLWWPVCFIIVRLSTRIQRWAFGVVIDIATAGRSRADGGLIGTGRELRR